MRPAGMRLPCPAEELIPHRRTMLLVDSLLACDPESGRGRVAAGARVAPVFVAEAERLAEVVLLEMMAQAYACLQGYRDRLAGRAPGLGFLVGVRRFSCMRKAFGGEALEVESRSRPRPGWMIFSWSRPGSRRGRKPWPQPN